MTTKAISKALGIPVRDVLKMIHAGKLPAVKVGGRWKIFDEDFQRWEGRRMKRAIPYTAAVAEQKPAGQIKMPEPAPAVDLDAVVERLLPFEGDQDEHMVWPLAKYVIEESDDGLFSTSAGEMFSGEYGTRDDAIDASRADLKIRLRAVMDLVEVKE